jgi:hypothetical protein
MSDLEPNINASGNVNAKSVGLFSPKRMFYTIAVLALGGIGSGYILQLNSRLASAESELRLLRVNHQLLTQELALEKILQPFGNNGYDQLSPLEIVTLTSAPSSGQMNVNFQVLWNPHTRQGVLLLDGEIEDAASYQLEFKIRSHTSVDSQLLTTIPTGAIPSSLRRRWFDVSDLAPGGVVGFELEMRLSEAAADLITFSGSLPTD